MVTDPEELSIRGDISTDLRVDLVTCRKCHTWTMWDPWRITLGVLSPGDLLLQRLLLTKDHMHTGSMCGRLQKSIIAYLFRHNNS